MSVPAAIIFRNGKNQSDKKMSNVSVVFSGEYEETYSLNVTLHVQGISLEFQFYLDEEDMEIDFWNALLDGKGFLSKGVRCFQLSFKDGLMNLNGYAVDSCVDRASINIAVPLDEVKSTFLEAISKFTSSNGAKEVWKMEMRDVYTIKYRAKHGIKMDSKLPPDVIQIINEKLDKKWDSLDEAEKNEWKKKVEEKKAEKKKKVEVVLSDSE